MGDIARFDVSAPGAVKQSRAAPRLIRTRWADDLVKWCRDRGIKSETAIAQYLGVDRSTLWRWKRGGKVTDANIAAIVEKTAGQIDPRNSGKRR